MTQQARNAYLENEAKTATPQKLRLMLIDGAIRFARLAATAVESGDDADCCETTSRCRSIVSELIGSIHRPEEKLHQKIIAIYVFVFQKLTEGQLNKDVTCFREAIDVLEQERDTWTQVCAKYPGKIPGLAPALKRPKDAAQAPIPPIGGPVTGTKFSLDA
jgi:flagellar protein FliS